MQIQIEWGGYTCKCTIDWLRLRMVLAAPTKFRYVRAELHKILGLEKDDPSVVVVAQKVKNSNDSASEFVFKLHDQHHLNRQWRITEILNALAGAFPVAAPIVIDGIEIAFDVYLSEDTPGEVSLPEVAQYLQTALEAPGKALRQYDPKTGQTLMLEDHPEPILGATFYSGYQAPYKLRKASPISHRTYFKVKDSGKELPAVQQRARAEVTLQGDALEQYGFADPMSLGHYDFTRVAALLHFQPLLPPNNRLRKTSLHRKTKAMIIKASVQQKEDQQPVTEVVWEKLRLFSGLVNLLTSRLAMERQCHTSSWPHGWLRKDAKGDYRREHSIHTQSDTVLNEKVSQALAKLCKELNKAPKTKRVRKPPR